MSKKITLGGERLGVGKQMEVALHGFNRSTHDLSSKFRSSMSAGTLVPCGWYLGLPGDKFEFDIKAECLTKPTLGPLYGSYKIQVDAFITPLRLYQRSLMINRTDIGMNMENVKMPKMIVGGTNPTFTQSIGMNRDFNTYQINGSALVKYLGVSGVGSAGDVNSVSLLTRSFTAYKLLMYWDIVYSYYTNKQEKIGYYIHNPLTVNNYTGTLTCKLSTPSRDESLQLTNSGTLDPSPTAFLLRSDSVCSIEATTITDINVDTIYIQTTDSYFWKATQIFSTWEINSNSVIFRNPINILGLLTGSFYVDETPESILDTAPRLEKYDLANIPQMRMDLMAHDDSSSFLISSNSLKPYGSQFKAFFTDDETARVFSVQSSQEGLAVKTYLSDVFNNWLDTENIDGDNGVNAITAVQVDEDGKFTIDQLNLKNKLYNVLNRIAVSDGTFKAWLEASYDEEMMNTPTTPVYIGGYSRELVFQEVVSNAAVNPENGEKQPLGTLAGRGTVINQDKGGKFEVYVNEPAYITLIASITPRIDYYQGNRWDMNLDSMDDLHVPGLDEIGFEDLITDRMAWWDTRIYSLGENQIVFKSAGKQPAWINYMTDYDEVFGSFARENDEQYMILARRFEPKPIDQGWEIKDLTTYIDPSKYNHIFADTRLDAENFQMQIGKRVTVRRKMSARVMPNL